MDDSVRPFDYKYVAPQRSDQCVAISSEAPEAKKKKNPIKRNIEIGIINRYHG